ncbi:hypothetical protein V0M98_32655 (plasmid) [Pseudomonas silesiensis]|uniref:hypothetical protein n=1 Tax=Pseudomonas silesiensis TaxID=1853130 RepID=UPI0030D28AFA
MHPTIGMIKLYLEVWYTNNSLKPVHLASLQIFQSEERHLAELMKKDFDVCGIDMLTPPTKAYLESFINNGYDLTCKPIIVG